MYKSILIAIKSTIFVILLVLFFKFYAEEAWNQYNERKTTFSVSPEVVNFTDPPVIVFCPIPNFKSSYFEENKIDELTEQFFWEHEENRTLANRQSSLQKLQ